MPYADAPFYPILYVRGYAMTRKEIDQTTADPFCGFNLGSTLYRAVPERKQPPRKFVFESPVVRLATDFGYRDVFEDGLDIVDPGWERTLPPRSIVVYRYYDEASTWLGTGKTPPIETFAKGLSDLILRVRDLVCRDPGNAMTEGDFRCYLVAHSMGGLVCRAFLQNRALGDDEARRCVDKFFTYATPHNGIDLLGVNVPEWLSLNDTDNFNRERMAGYLALKDLHKKTGRVDWLRDDQFPVDRVFCMVGTNRGDYDVALGASRTFAGHGSDGLVRVGNASVWSIRKDGTRPTPCATGYAYRSHSGPFGIVNSEEAFQNLSRFLFGDVRVDIWAEVKSVSLPEPLEGKKVDALYQFELLAQARGKPWYLSRRTAEEDSVACRRHADLAKPKSADDRKVYLASVFLANRARVDSARRTLAYKMTFGVRVPDYQIDRKFWLDGHFEGSYLFRDAVTVELEPPEAPGKTWRVGHWWETESRASSSDALDAATIKKGAVDLVIPFASKTKPGIEGAIRLRVSAWNV